MQVLISAEERVTFMFANGFAYLERTEHPQVSLMRASPGQKT